ncbi:hypothetical protein AAC387_Pa07g1960 [Persea americana]
MVAVVVSGEVSVDSSGDKKRAVKAEWRKRRRGKEEQQRVAACCCPGGVSVEKREEGRIQVEAEFIEEKGKSERFRWRPNTLRRKGGERDSGEGPSSGGSRSAAGPADDDVAVVDAIESDDEVDGGYDEDADYDELEGEFIASDDGDDEIDDGDSEDEGVRPRRVVSAGFDEGSSGGAGRGDEGDDVGPSKRYEWREVPIDGYARRKRVGGDTGCSKALAGTSIIRRTGRGDVWVRSVRCRSILRGETLRLSHLVEKKDTKIVRLRALVTAERERRRENEAIIEALADSHEV